MQKKKKTWRQKLFEVAIRKIVKNELMLVIVFNHKSVLLGTVYSLLQPSILLTPLWKKWKSKELSGYLANKHAVKTITCVCFYLDQKQFQIRYIKTCFIVKVILCSAWLAVCSCVFIGLIDSVDCLPCFILCLPSLILITQSMSHVWRACWTRKDIPKQMDFTVAIFHLNAR